MKHLFLGESPALDFVGSRFARNEEEPWEMLRTPEAFDAWCVQSGQLPEQFGASEAEFARAIELREASYRLLLATIRGDGLPAAELDVVNRCANEAPLTRALSGSGRIERTGDVTALLSELARGVIEIAGGDDAKLLRECGRPECTQLYIDRSRGQRREWCSMAICGSRMKARAYRERRKLSTAPVSK